MEGLIKFISGFQGFLLIGMMIFIVLLLVLIIVLFSSISSLEKRYRKLMRGANNSNLEELIINYLDKIDEAKELSESVRNKYNDIDTRLKSCIQRISIVRYRAFDDVGSDLSFSIAFLDDNNNGAILTGIYGRNDSTTYAKPIDNGISRYDLSDEEKFVLNDAMNKELPKQDEKA